ncbi:P83/100 family protein [Treponema sp. J25]|uniref:P83/100 family protein n=1 Tax=Treponema sp. J25 TaxID=2094121 RepID=UPI001052FAB3|nr:P83/100 family protein [Treponema sp. J25]TCW60861.1 hypothetical protein C5O22_09400 [Treponema sp. J25]
MGDTSGFQKKACCIGLLWWGIFFYLIPSAFAQEAVDRQELEKARSAQIIFINYEGPHGRIDTRDDIWAIGYALGRAIRAGATEAGSMNRYHVVHILKAQPSPGTLNADVFSLGIDVGVDHIRNLRLILQGYLEGAYEYNKNDAALLATFITLYNAVYRGDIAYLQSRYVPEVASRLQPGKAGLALRFDDWPGKTQMLIPLATGEAGSLRAIDTTSLTDKGVTEQLRKESDRGVEPRKDMVDLKERQIQEAQQQATLQREAIVQEEQRLAAERAALEAEKARIAQQEQAMGQQQAGQTGPQGTQAATAGSAAPQTPPEGAPASTAAAGQAGASPSEQTLAEQKQAVQEKEASLAQREQELARQKETLAALEKEVEQKKEEVKEDRREIARDQQVLIQQEEAKKPSPTGILGFQLLQQNSPLGRFLLLQQDDPRTILGSSTLNTINGRTILYEENVIYAIAGMAQGTGAIRLVRINATTLEMIDQGKDDISATSLLWKFGKDLYALVVAEGKTYLGRFDTNLALQARSRTEVHPYATVEIRNGTLLTQQKDGAPLLLVPTDLTEKR